MAQRKSKEHFEKFLNEVFRALSKYVNELKHYCITLEHMLLFVLSQREIAEYLIEKNIAYSELMVDLANYLDNSSKYLSYKQVIGIADKKNVVSVTLTNTIRVTEHTLLNRYLNDQTCELNYSTVLWAISENNNTYAKYFLDKYRITSEFIEKMMIHFTITGLGTGAKGDAATTILKQYCIDLNEKATNKQLDPLVGRTKEVFNISHTMGKKKKSNVLLVGEPGVGKTQIVEGLAQRIVEGAVPNILKDSVIYRLDIGHVLAGCKYRGEFEEKVRDIMEALINTPNAILFIDEAHQITAGEGNSNSGVGFSAMMKPVLSRGGVRVIAGTTWDGYRKTFEKDTALMRRFRVLSVNEPTAKETVEIMLGGKNSLEEFHGCTIDDDAIEACVTYTVKYQTDRFLPDKSIDILDSACARAKVLGTDLHITRHSIAQEIEEVTGIAIRDTMDDESTNMRILSMAKHIKEHVFEQDAAIDEVEKALVISHTGLKDPNKPIGSFLFVGPSGCGKTMLAKQVAKHMDMHLLKYDMSEFQEKHALSRLVGAPPGYAGYGDGQAGEGQLINDLIRYPNSVILFDEVEKAHADVFSILLQMLDEGSVSGSNGRKADCKNCIIILSSNLGTKESNKASLGFHVSAKGKSASDSAVENFFLTEVRGRLTAMIHFNKLNALTYRRIVLEKIRDIELLLSAKNIRLTPEEKLIDYILEQNKHAEYGAREIDKIVSNLIKYPLSVKILAGDIKPNSTVLLGWDNDKLTFQNQNSNIKVVE